MTTQQELIMQYWHIFIVAVSIFNFIWYVVTCIQAKREIKRDEELYLNKEKLYDARYFKCLRKYQHWQQCLCFPYILQCAQRSFYPNIYNTRIVFYDSGLNSVFLSRFLATYGEVAWILQVCIVIHWLNFEISHGRGKSMTFGQYVTNYISIFAVILCFMAEFFCNHAMFTTNTYWNLYEITLWSIALALLTLCMWFLICLIPHKTPKGYNGYQLKYFSWMMFIVGVVFIIDLLFDHIPHQLQHSQQQYGESAHQTMQLYHGVKGSIFDRVVSQSYDDWKDDLIWMGGYFSGGAWTSILMVNAPRLKIINNKESIKIQ